MKQVTLVMLYGTKPSRLSALILACQEQITRALGDYFQPYALFQIHATLVSLARVAGSAMSNLYLNKYRNQAKQMDMRELLDFLRFGGRFPFQIQIGGFQNRNYPFTSQGQKPYERSFSLSGRNPTIALMVGWPIRGKPLTIAEFNKFNLLQEEQIYPNILHETRQAVQNFNILHAYHQKLTDIDNDFYMRIGLIHQLPPDHASLKEVEATLRECISTVEPIIIEITLSDIYVVSYQDETLPLASTQAWPLDDAKVTHEFIWNLYE